MSRLNHQRCEYCAIKSKSFNQSCCCRLNVNRKCLGFHTNNQTISNNLINYIKYYLQGLYKQQIRLMLKLYLIVQNQIQTSNTWPWLIHKRTWFHIYEEYFWQRILKYKWILLEKMNDVIWTNPNIILLYPNPSPLGPKA